MIRDPKRVDDLWDTDRVNAVACELSQFPSYAIFSGGWAWHYMSPTHEEKKLHHDHKDVDILVAPEKYVELVNFLQERGYERVWTKFDKHAKNFYRYEKHLEYKKKSVKVLIDVFLEDVPSVVACGMSVVEPKTLLSFYGNKHTTDDCTAVKAATKLLIEGQNPIGRKELVS